MRAAAIVILFMAGGAFWYYRDYTRVTPPEITDRVKSAMLLCQENGRNEAEIVSPLQTTAGRQPIVSHAEKVLYHVDDDFAEELEKASRVTTYQDKEYWVKLDDGSLVHLNYDTHLIYPEKFGDRRDVILDGEAYFMVAKDKSRAFLVHTSQGDIRVHGTEFYINTRKEQQEQTSVVLVKGSVSFATTDGKETMMQPGQQLTATQGQIQQKEVDVSLYQAWNEGEFVFADEPLENLLMTMARWYNLEIEYANEDARQMRFTGTIDRYGSAEVILHSISKVTGLVIEQNGSHVVIR